MILTIDIGGTSIKYATIDRDKRLSNKGSISTITDDYGDFINSIIKIYDQLENIEGVSIACPGAIDNDGKSIGISAIPCIYGNNIRNDISNYTGKRAEIINDANSSLISEQWVDPTINNAVGIVIGTGIGGAIIANGEMIVGHNFSAGEIGLIQDINKDLTLYNTTTSLSQSARRYSQETNTNTDGKELVSMIDNNSKAKDYYEDFINRTVLLIMNLEFIVNPEKIFLSGAIVNDENFMNNVSKRYDEVLETNEGMFNLRSQIHKATFGADSNLYGAAYNWIKKESYKK